jgi:hypothetical protein
MTPAEDDSMANSETSTRRSPEEVQRLVASWRADPLWDLEETEGFEAHREELKAIRLDYDRQRAAAYEERLRKRAESLGTDSLKLAAYVETLERRLEEIEARLDAEESTG